MFAVPVNSLPGAPRATPALPDNLFRDRQRLLDASDTIRRLDDEVASLRKELEASRAQAKQLESHVEGIVGVGPWQTIAKLDAALTHERVEAVALRAEIIELRDAVQRAAGADRPREGSTQPAGGGTDSEGALHHELTRLQGVISCLEEELERERTVTRTAAEHFNREYVAKLRHEHAAEARKLTRELHESRAQLDDARAMLAAHSAGRHREPHRSVLRHAIEY